MRRNNKKKSKKIAIILLILLLIALLFGSILNRKGNNIETDTQTTQVSEKFKGNMNYTIVEGSSQDEVVISLIAKSDKGIKQIELPDGTIKYYNSEKEVIFEYTVNRNANYTFKVIDVDGYILEKVINIPEVKDEVNDSQENEETENQKNEDATDNTVNVNTQNKNTTTGTSNSVKEEIQVSNSQVTQGSKPDSGSQDESVEENKPNSGSQGGDAEENKPDSGNQGGSEEENKPDSGNQGGDAEEEKPDSGNQGEDAEEEKPDSGDQGGNGDEEETVDIPDANQNIT